MVVKTKKLNKQRNKYTSTKRKVSRRTRKNNLVLRGGGDDVEIYYKQKTGAFSSEKIEPIQLPNSYSTPKVETNNLKYINSKLVLDIPYIKAKNEGIYTFKFTIIPYKCQLNNQTFIYKIEFKKNFFGNFYEKSKQEIKSIPTNDIETLFKTCSIFQIKVDIEKKTFSKDKNKKETTENKYILFNNLSVIKQK
jgi:hypothetical protein